MNWSVSAKRWFNAKGNLALFGKVVFRRLIGLAA
jgi:hypothetical protein